MFPPFEATDEVSARSLKKRFDAMIGAIGDIVVDVPAGVIIGHGAASAPSGYLVCDGSAVSRTTYAALFAVIGTVFGAGDGSTTFNLPDLRGRAPIGVGTGSGLSARTLGQSLGAETHQLTTAELPAHTHTVKATLAAQPITVTGGAATAVSGTALGSTGSDTPHNNMQPSLVLNWIIKT